MFRFVDEIRMGRGRQQSAGEVPTVDPKSRLVPLSCMSTRPVSSQAHALRGGRRVNFWSFEKLHNFEDCPVPTEKDFIS